VAEATRTAPFEAVVICPRCHLVDVHQMRAPNPAPTDAEIARWEREHTTHEVRQWGVAKPVRVIHDPPRPVDESVYEVIRICRCGHEWGMA